MTRKNDETLEKDMELRFPHIFSVEASAGSGKTYTLTLRVLQFLLSGNIPDNKPANILGITFTNNSAKDMKRQILDKLKSLSIGGLDKKTADYISDITTFGELNPAEAAERIIDGILSNYHDFQIRTIDSFTSKILKASALEIGLPPDFEISTESHAVINYAVESMTESANKALLEEFLDMLNRNQTGGGIDFNPVKSIKDRMKYLLETESNYNCDFSFDFSFKERLDENLEPVIKGMKNLLEEAERQGLELKGNFKQESVDKIKNYLSRKNYFKLVSERKGFPYKKQKTSAGGRDYSKEWNELSDCFNEYLPDITKLKNLPYLTLYESFKDKLTEAYKILGLVYLSDINKKLSRFLIESSVPEIYFHLGNVIYHYFIDEFQDTNKVQWQILKPLIEESLSKGGSLFTVGDLKQALYGFRGADYKIMKSLLDDGGKSFPSSKEFKSVSLKTNFRSDKVLVDYVNSIFKKDIKDKAESVGDPAGFLTYSQDTPEDETGKKINCGGYYSTEIFELKTDAGENENKDKIQEMQEMQDQDNPSDEPSPEPSELSESSEPLEPAESSESSVSLEPLDLIEERLIEIIEDLKFRNYNLGDIAVLAQKNKYLEDIAGRLIDKGYPVVAQSSLDIRSRKVIKEIELLLNFLNYPIDDFNFGCFILGDIFQKVLNGYSKNYSKNMFEKFIFEANLKNAKPLYVIFQDQYQGPWNEYFEELFNKTGYLPLYEIVLNIYNIFNLTENFSYESAYLAHFLDTVQFIEKRGSANLNDLTELMSSKSDYSSELFSIELPEVKDALTLLTVHKAKGLQWKAVINVFFAEENYALKSSESNSRSNKGFNKNDFPASVEKNGGGSSLDLFYITKQIASKSDYLESIYNEAAKDENISDLNMFYVALTRAEHEMYNLIISKKGCALSPSSAGVKPFMERDGKTGGEKENNEKKDNERIGLNCGYCVLGFESAIKTGRQYLSIKRGDFYHAVLSEIKYDEDFENLDALIEKYMVLFKFKADKTDIKDIKEKIKKIKENGSLLKLFDKKIYEVFTEKEYLSAAGSVYRMDRVSMSKESGEICILDYKTGDMNKEEEESYKNQLDIYKSVLSSIYKDKKISAVIYNIDNCCSLEC